MLSIQKSSKFVNTSDIAKMAAPKAAQFLYNMLRVGPRVILRSAFELLRANTITRLLSAIVLISFDTVSLIRKRISVKQYIINLGLALLLLVGGTAGWVLGNDVLGAVILENVMLGMVAGLIGAGLFGGLTGLAWDKIIHLFLKDDTEDMLDICNKVFDRYTAENQLTEEEITQAEEQIIITRNDLRLMYAQPDREAYAQELINRGMEK